MPTRTTPEALTHLRVPKDHARRLLALDDQDTVLITELHCTEPGCPPLETVIAVLAPDWPPQRWTLHRPLNEVTPGEIADALADAAHQGED
jgi:hypothetical protein